MQPWGNRTATLQCFRRGTPADVESPFYLVGLGLGYPEEDDVWDYVHLADALLGHVALWCQEDVVDLEGHPVPVEQRKVLDPGVFISYLHDAEKRMDLTWTKVYDLVENVPERLVDADCVALVKEHIDEMFFVRRWCWYMTSWRDHRESFPIRPIVVAAVDVEPP